MTVDEFLIPTVRGKRTSIPISEVLAVTSALIAQCREKRKWILANKPKSKPRTGFIERLRQERLAYERTHSRLKCLRFVRQARRG